VSYLVEGVVDLGGDQGSSPALGQDELEIYIFQFDVQFGLHLRRAHPYVDGLLVAHLAQQLVHHLVPALPALRPAIPLPSRLKVVHLLFVPAFGVLVLQHFCEACDCLDKADMFFIWGTAHFVPLGRRLLGFLARKFLGVGGD